MKRIEHIYPSWAVLNDGSQDFLDYPIKYLNTFHPFKEGFNGGNAGSYYGIDKKGHATYGIESRRFDIILSLQQFIELTKPDEKNTLTIGAEYLYEFKDFEEWINMNQEWHKQYVQEHVTISVNTQGRVCSTAFDFRHSRDNKLFPVKVYSLERAIDK